jgi:hypothetical protein
MWLSTHSHLLTTERHGRVVKTPASYSGGTGSNLGLETGHPDSGYSWFSSLHPGETRDSTLKLGHDLFISTHHYLSTLHSTLYSPIKWQSVAKYTTNICTDEVKTECRCTGTTAHAPCCGARQGYRYVHSTYWRHVNGHYGFRYYNREL